MPESPLLILGIETSCDETAAAVVENGCKVRSNVIATQHELHERYAGVVPEIASRAHIERLVPVIRQAMSEAGIGYEQLDAVAVGHRPGLIGSLLVGVSAAKAMAWALHKPLLGVDHVLAHLHGGLLDAEPVRFPAIGIVVSGGHTSLFHLRDQLNVQRLGRTIDDALGEAYDKAATILHLGYPGGPALDRLAQTGNDRSHRLPITMLDPESLDFSFSGLKTSLLYAVCGHPEGRGRHARLPRSAESLSLGERADYAASFQKAAIDTVIRKLDRAFKRFPVSSLLVGGGVSANSRLRNDLAAWSQHRGVELRLPKLAYCIDNAAMIAGAAAARFRAGLFDDWSLAASTESQVAEMAIESDPAVH